MTNGRDIEKAMTGDEIFIVDDDPAVRDAFSSLFSQVGYLVANFADGMSFVTAAQARTPAAVVLDVSLPRKSGLDILEEIDAPHYGAPIFVISDRSDIPTAVEAIKRGASDFFVKCSNAESLVARVCEAINKRSNGHQNGSGPGTEPRSFPGCERLTPRERAVLARVASGASSQQTADQLGISRRTVEAHRAHILAKLNAKNTADLVRIVMNHGRGHPLDERPADG